MKNLKYLAAYIIPIATLIGIDQLGMWTYLTVGIAFVLIPLLEQILPISTNNISKADAHIYKKKSIFDIMLYVNIIWVYVVLYYAFYTLSNDSITTYEYSGLLLSIGIVLGSNGINVAHELGHRDDKISHILSHLLLLPSFYLHFFIEHNKGHHLNVGTLKDPATSRINESVYMFWIRSVVGSYLHAWQINNSILRKSGRKFWNLHNSMLLYTIATFGYIGLIYIFWGPSICLFSVGVGIVGFLLLETINYIEHYGLVRELLPNGRYQRVESFHSWNSNHELGRIFLYELTRHSDHHYISNKKYQILDHHDASPQLPYGYPTSMLISFIPPIWFRLMNPLVHNAQRSSSSSNAPKSASEY